MGAANNRSIAAYTASAAVAEGCNVMLTYQNERLLRNVEGIKAELEKHGTKVLIHPCDVTIPAQVQELFTRIRDEWGQLDGLVHSLAFAPRETMQEPYSSVSWEQYMLTVQVSAFSFVDVVREFVSLAPSGGSVVTFTFGAGRVYPHYTVIGTAKAALEESVRQLAVELGPKRVRVNTVSSGPVDTLAAHGIPQFSEMRNRVQTKAPRGTDVSQSATADVALFLLSSQSRAVTGHVLMADGGYSLLGV